jgi:hypothetical protein
VYPKVSGLDHTKWTTKNTRWEATKRIMTTKLTRLTHKIAILHLVAESCTICSSRCRRPVRKLFDTPSYVRTYVHMHARHAYTHTHIMTLPVRGPPITKHQAKHYSCVQIINEVYTDARSLACMDWWWHQEVTFAVLLEQNNSDVERYFMADYFQSSSGSSNSAVILKAIR